ncbi:recombination mediator protein UvsY [bacterium]|nr:recombination mediator protein UvsY [bacterium]
MNLEQLHAEWKSDSQIEFNKLDVSSVETPKLHAKYLELLSTYKLRLKDAEFKQKELMKNKFLWYNGKLDQSEIEKLGWDPDPFDGLRILKGEMQHYVEADPELVASEAKMAYLNTMIETLKEILESIKWRHQTIRNALEWKKFEAGF